MKTAVNQMRCSKPGSPIRYKLTVSLPQMPLAPSTA